MNSLLYYYVRVKKIQHWNLNNLKLQLGNQVETAKVILLTGVIILRTQKKIKIL